MRLTGRSTKEKESPEASWKSMFLLPWPIHQHQEKNSRLRGQVLLESESSPLRKAPRHRVAHEFPRPADALVHRRRESNDDLLLNCLSTTLKVVQHGEPPKMVVLALALL